MFGLIFGFLVLFCVGCNIFLGILYVWLDIVFFYEFCMCFDIGFFSRNFVFFGLIFGFLVLFCVGCSIFQLKTCPGCEFGSSC